MYFTSLRRPSHVTRVPCQQEWHISRVRGKQGVPCQQGAAYRDIEDEAGAMALQFDYHSPPVSWAPQRTATTVAPWRGEVLADSTRQTQECDTSTPIHVDASLPLDNTTSGSRAAPTPSSHGLRTTVTTSLYTPCGIRESVESAAIDIISARTPCASDLPLGDIPADGSHDCDIGSSGDTYDDEHAEIASLRRYMTFKDLTFVGQRSQQPPEFSDSRPSTTIPAHDKRGRKRRHTEKQPAYESSDREVFSSGDNLTSPDGVMWTTPPTQQALTGDFRPLKVGGRYESMDVLRDAVVFCAVASGFEFRLKRSNKMRYYATCAHPDCPWTLEGKTAHANGHTEIVRLTPHRPGCRKSVQPDLKCNKHAKLRWVELMVEKKLLEDSGTTSTKLKKWFDKAVKSHVSYNKCLRARTYVLRTLNGPPEEGFCNLRRYCRMLHETNPGSIIDLECEGNVFVLMFFTLAAPVTGFAHCRPLIVLDRAHIRGKYEGCLLGATGQDANSQCFPLAYAIVDGERKTHWKWFLVLLKRLCAVPKMDHKIVTIMSDRDKGLIPAVSEEFGDERHAYCVRHVSGNLLKSLRLKKEQAAMLLEAAGATCEEVFNYYMQRGAGYSRHKNIANQIFDKAHKRHSGDPHFVHLSAEQQEMPTERGGSGLKGGVGVDGGEQTGRIEVMEEMGMKGMGREGDGGTDLLEGEEIKGSAGQRPRTKAYRPHRYVGELGDGWGWRGIGSVSVARYLRWRLQGRHLRASAALDPWSDRYRCAG
ncbi:hypothetical protein CBR_g37073 [Chara braunii]|uniref:MULE transposase domain-containing protein n=1 Tax=Chara braunii TaxID=69332 RepID=A0A388LM08_CHABU|nr:hypothetical protein CBR_g37073 [Chara braunii]|eukprot:GBG83359.1 hypothetical protein CBR_g37073 [Chara braunii]